MVVIVFNNNLLKINCYDISLSWFYDNSKLRVNSLFGRVKKGFYRNQQSSYMGYLLIGVKVIYNTYTFFTLQKLHISMCHLSTFIFKSPPVKLPHIVLML